jgi:hypothetical protein
VFTDGQRDNALNSSARRPHLATVRRLPLLLALAAALVLASCDQSFPGFDLRCVGSSSTSELWALDRASGDRDTTSGYEYGPYQLTSVAADGSNRQSYHSLLVAGAGPRLTRLPGNPRSRRVHQGNGNSRRTATLYDATQHPMLP